MKEIYKNHIADLLLSALFLTLGILLIPAIGISSVVLNYIVAAVLLLYLFLFLVKKLTVAKGTILVLTVVEFIVIILIALGLILKELQVINLGETFQIIGLVIWLRGVVCLVKGYLISSPEARRKYSLLLFLGYIAMVTAGAYFFFANPIRDNTLELVMCILAFSVFALFLVLTIIYWPRKKGEKKQKNAKASRAKSEEKK